MDGDLVHQFEQGGRAIAPFTGDEDRFRALFDAYRAADRDSFRRLLAEAQLLERCELVCGWLCNKECTLVCLELCGPLPQELPSLRAFAEVVVRISSDEELVERIANAVTSRDSQAFGALVEELAIGPFCHLLCLWVCEERCRLICRVLCFPQLVELGDLADALTASGQAVARLLKNEKALAEAANSLETLNCDLLRAAITEVGLVNAQCELICRWLCAWRCVWLCTTLCEQFPPPEAAIGLTEAFKFAGVAARLTQTPAVVERLISAAEARDATAWEAVLKESNIGVYCLQLCRWICELLCERFCFCVCPPSSVAIFTKIGGLYYDFDVASGLGGNGLTTDRRAFFETLRLNGGIALAASAPQIQYRFETAPTDVNGNPTGPWTPVPGNKILPTNIGTFLLPGPPFFIEVWVNNSGPHKFNITPTADGWVTVPPMSPSSPPYPPGVTQFVPGADLLVINSADPTLLQPWPANDETGVVAGGAAKLVPTPGSNLGTTSAGVGPGAVASISVAALAAAIPGGIGISVGGVTFQVAGAGAASGATSIAVVSQAVAGTIPAGVSVMALNAYYGIRMRLRTLGDLSDGSDAGTCVHAAINNTTYNNVQHAYSKGSGEMAVYEIGVQELVVDVCGDIAAGTIHVLFTAAHPNLGDVGITITGDGIAGVAVPLPPPVPEDFYASVPYGVAGLPSCAYILTLSVNLLLTTGDVNFGPPLIDQIAFCKTGPGKG